MTQSTNSSRVYSHLRKMDPGYRFTARSLTKVLFGEEDTGKTNSISATLTTLARKGYIRKMAEREGSSRAFIYQLFDPKIVIEERPFGNFSGGRPGRRIERTPAATEESSPEKIPTKDEGETESFEIVAVGADTLVLRGPASGFSVGDKLHLGYRRVVNEAIEQLMRLL